MARGDGYQLGTAPARRVNWAMPGQDHSLRPAQLADIESVSGEEGRGGGQVGVGGGKVKGYLRPDRGSTTGPRPHRSPGVILVLRVRRKEGAYPLSERHCTAG